MTDAIRWQKPRAVIGSRALAAFVAWWFVVAYLLTVQHTSETAHVRDAMGRAYHVASTVPSGPDDGRSHAAPRSGGAHDHDNCALAAASPPAVLVVGLALGSAPACRACVDAPRVLPVASRGARGLYRLAPKTSPPAA